MPLAKAWLTKAWLTKAWPQEPSPAALSFVVQFKGILRMRPVKISSILRPIMFGASMLACGAAVAQQCSPAQCQRLANEIRAYAQTAGSPQSIAVLQDMHRRYYACGCK